MADLVYCSTSLLFFDISLLHYCIGLRSSIIFYLFSRDIYFSLGISLSSSMFSLSLSTTSDILRWSVQDFSDFISNCTINQITNCFCLFLHCSFWSSYKCICNRLSRMIKKCLSIFSTSIFTHIFSNVVFAIFISSLNWIMVHFFIFYTLFNKKSIIYFILCL